MKMDDSSQQQNNLNRIVFTHNERKKVLLKVRLFIFISILRLLQVLRSDLLLHILASHRPLN
jgi:hypothetical protein